VSLLAPVGEFIESLVHPTARRDGLTLARHRAFIGPRLLGGLLALAAFPVVWALRGAPSPVEAIALGWMSLVITPTVCVRCMTRLRACRFGT